MINNEGMWPQGIFYCGDNMPPHEIFYWPFLVYLNWEREGGQSLVVGTGERGEERRYNNPSPFSR